MDVSIVIVNWNSRHFLDACIRSIQRHTSGIDYEIVVIDSGSFDGCDKLLRREFPQVRFVQSDVNLGFAGANNRAYACTTGRFVLFLNGLQIIPRFGKLALQVLIAAGFVLLAATGFAFRFAALTSDAGF